MKIKMLFLAIVIFAVPAIAADKTPAKKMFYSTPAYVTVNVYRTKKTQCLVAQGVPIEKISVANGVALVKYHSVAKKLEAPYCKNGTLYTVPVDELNRRYTYII